jgi:PIN domain nuclease of toxin-antitoxin system
MKLLLDTHALVWWWADDRQLPTVARAAIADPANAILVSAASAWEIATKHRVGKWPEVAPIVDQFLSLVLRSRFMVLSISAAHALAAGALEGPHRDPFDRMLIAQARDAADGIVSADSVFRTYGANVIWDAPEIDANA